MKKALLFFLVLGCFSQGYAQNKITGYRYWYDNNIASAVFTSVIPSVNYNLNTSFAAGSLSAGIHVFTIQFLDDSNRYSAAIAQYFVSPTQNNIIAYEYWIDNNYAGKTITPTTSAAVINISSSISPGTLSGGLHTISMRFLDNTGEWSSPIIQYFVNQAPANITAFEYWIDSNYTGKTITPVTSSAVSTLLNSIAPGTLAPGIHNFNIRYRDDAGEWSSLQTQYFNVDNTNSLLNGYRYWYDNKTGLAIKAGKFTTAAIKDSIKGLLATTSVDSGIHAIHFQFRDNSGLWSSTTSDTFYKNSKAGIDSIGPDSVGNIAVDTITITGNGLTDSTQVKLTMKAQTDITSIKNSIVFISANKIKAAFDFHNKKPGFWNVVVTIPHDTIMTRDSGLRIFNGIFITGKIDSIYQASQKVTVQYHVPYPFDTSNVFSLQLLNNEGKLMHIMNIGKLKDTGSNSISCTLPANLIAGCGYAFRIVASSPHRTSPLSGSFAIEDAVAPIGDYALKFDGNSGWVDLGKWFTNDSFTISFWLNPDSGQSNGAGVMDIQSGMAFFSHDYNFAPNNYVIFNNLRQDLLPGKWNHVTITVNGKTGTRKLYLFGQLVKTSVLSYTPASGHDMKLGTWYFFPKNYWKGMLDELKIYNYILPDSAILNGVNKRLKGTEPGLLAYWDFNDAQCSTTSIDRTSNQRQAILEDSGVVRVPSTVPNIGRQVVPGYGGNTNIVFVNIFGAGFLKGATVTMKLAGHKDINADSVVVNPDGSKAFCRFNLNGTDTGLYDVLVNNPDTTTFTYPRSFTVQTGSRPNVWLDIIGRNVVTSGATNTVMIVYGNSGNVAAKMVPISFAVSDTNSKVELLFKYHASKDTSAKWDSVFKLVPQYAVIDSLFGEPFSGKLFKFYIPLIMPNVSGTLVFKITTKSGSVAPVVITAWVDSPLYQSPVNKAYVDCIHSTVSAVLGPIIGTVPVAGCLYTVADKVLYPLIMASQYGAQYYDEYSWSTAFDVLDIIVGCLPAVGALKFAAKSLTNPTFLKTTWNTIVRNWDLISSGEGLGTSGRSFFNDCQDAYSAYNRSKKTLNQKTVGALDPNFKSGPSKYVQSNAPFAYTIGFQNKPSATAPAQVVTIIDTLDKSKFDLKTFNFGVIGWGDSVYLPTYSSQTSFTVSYNYVAQDSLVVSVEGRLDTASGVVRWKFSSLDPKTLNVTDNPLRGFLPPDDSTHRGEGFVVYNLKLKPGFPTSTAISNSASIIFDFNNPITTPAQKNVVDNNRPYSAIAPITLSNDTTLNLTWTGKDTGSAIAYYDIYYSDNGGAYIKVLSRTMAASASFFGKLYHTYKFFSLATDSAGNIETDTIPIRSITLLPTSVASASQFAYRLRNVPNPFKDECVIEFTLPDADNITLSISDLYGRTISIPEKGFYEAGEHSYHFKSGSLAEGIYMITLKTSKGSFFSKMILEK